MKFSIILPNYNSEKWIEECLNSILNQTFKDYEIIIVDDISQDGSFEKAIDVIGNKQPTTFVKNITKRLNGGTRNVGIAQAQGDYIIFIDCDDWFKDNTVFEKINNALINNEDILFMGYDFYNGNSLSNIPNYTNIEQAIKDVTCAPWTKVVKTSILKDTPFPEGTLYEDRIQHYKTLLKCKSFKVLNESVYVWNRLNAGSIVSNNNYSYYAFDYARELCFLIKKVEDKQLKEYFKNELKGYMNRLNKLAGAVYGE